MTEEQVSLVLLPLVAVVAGAVTLAFVSIGRLDRRIQVIRMRRLLGLLADAEICVSYSHDAKEQMARLGVNPEQVETVLARPASAVRRAMSSSVQLERELGSRALTVLVGEPWPPFGEFHVKRVKWRTRPGRGGLLHALARTVGALTRRDAHAPGTSGPGDPRRHVSANHESRTPDGAAPE